METLVESKHCMTVATIYITASQYGKLLSNTTAQQLRLIKFDLNSVSQQAVQEGDLDSGKPRDKPQPKFRYPLQPVTRQVVMVRK